MLALGLVLFVAFLVLWRYPSNEYIFLPDKAHPVAPLVDVKGGHDPNNSGGIYFVDVVVRKATLLERLFGGLHEGADLHSPQEVVPPGLNDSQEHEVDLADMQRSQRIAAAVALRALGEKVRATPTGVLVTAIDGRLPAAGKLRPSDVIVAVDGKPVRTPRALTTAMKANAVGASVRFTVRRGSDKVPVTIKTVADPHNASHPIVGILVGQATDIHLPRKVSIDANGVGGPSAGLPFALEVMEQLGRNVDGGLKIAATGEMFLDGQVGPIGGVKQKTIGARQAGVDAFLVPVGNAVEARKYAHGLRIVPVKSFQQALAALKTLRQS